MKPFSVSQIEPNAVTGLAGRPIGLLKRLERVRRKMGCNERLQQKCSWICRALLRSLRFESQNLTNKTALPLSWKEKLCTLQVHGGFALYGLNITFKPASAPLRSLTRPSLAAYQTLSLRSLRFESQNPTNKTALPLSWKGRFDLASPGRFAHFVTRITRPPA